MLRYSQTTSAIVVLAASCFVVGFGCHLAADIEAKDLRSAGAGGAGSSSSGEMASTSSGGPSPTCESIPPPSLECQGPMMKCPMGPLQDIGCHCGECFRDCGGIGGCIQGECIPRKLLSVSGKRIPRAASTGSAIYFPAFVEGMPKSEIHGVNSDGKNLPTPNPIAQNIDGYVNVIAADCNTVYFATTKEDGGAEEAVWRLSVTSGMVDKLPKPPDGDVGGIESIVVDGLKVYWTDFRGVGIWVKGTPAATRIPTDAGFKAVGLAIDGSNLYWSEYSLDLGEGRIRHAMITDSGAMANATFTKYIGLPGQIALDGTRIYWTDVPATGIHSIKWILRSDLGKMPLQLLAATMDKKFSDSIHTDGAGSYVYFIEDIDGNATTYRASKPGGSVREPIADQPFSEQWLVGDSKRIYMVTPKNGASPGFGQIDWVAK